MSGLLRCAFCFHVLPKLSVLESVRAMFGGDVVCRRCGRGFSRKMAQQAARSYSRILEDFQNRLADQIKRLPIGDRAETLVQLGLKMEEAKIASADILLRTLAEHVHSQVALMAHGHEGRLDVRRVDRGRASCIDVDAVVNDGARARRSRFRIARVEPTGFIQVDLTARDAARTARAANGSY